MSPDTIAAISTTIGEGAINIIRLSGDQALAIIEKIFSRKPRQFASHHIYYGFILKPLTNTIVDEVLVSYFKAPRTYTREDIIEINCHGGLTVARSILDLVVEQGARIAEPGEFTKRAFLNGRLDLTQAEAVIDLIRAKTENSASHSLYQLRGGLKHKIADLFEKTKKILIQLELMTDFSEEDLDLNDYHDLKNDIDQLVPEMENLIKTAEEGKIFREGVKLIIAGKPNVGKSSLLNILLEEQRAIVTPIAGTTRDIIEEHLNIKGIPFILCDTAGITISDDIIEMEGVKRSRKAIRKADLILVVHDASDKKDSGFRLPGVAKHKIIEIYNKFDKVEKRCNSLEYQGKLCVSAKTGFGVERLKEKLASRVAKKKFMRADHPFLSNVRQKKALAGAIEGLLDARRSLEEGRSAEFVSLDVRIALDSLGEISGRITCDDLLNSIFASFCVGK